MVHLVKYGSWGGRVYDDWLGKIIVSQTPAVVDKKDRSFCGADDSSDAGYVQKIAKVQPLGSHQSGAQWGVHARKYGGKMGARKEQVEE